MTNPEFTPGNQPPDPLAPEAGMPAGVIPAASTYTAPPGADPEQAYRQEVVQACVEAAVGTVGIYTSADLSYKEKSQLVSTISARNPGRPDAARTMPEYGGYGNYGERAIAGAGDAVSRKVSKESGKSKDMLAFVETEDGRVDVRYGFSASWYTDASGRGGNTLEVGFILPRDAALELRDLVQKDPSLADEVVEAQVLALGIPKKDLWDKSLKPRYGYRGHKDYIPEEDRVLEVITCGSDGATQETSLPRANRLALLPEPTLAAVESNPAHTDSGTSEEYVDQKANEALAEVTSDAETQLDHGRPLEKVLESFANAYYSMDLDASDPQLAENSELKMYAVRYRAAYDTVYSKLLEGALLKPDGGQDFAKKYLHDIMVRYVKTAARDEGQAWAIADYELRTVDRELESQLGVRLTKQDIDSAFIEAQQQALQG